MCAHACVFAFDRAVVSERVKWVHALTEVTSSSLKVSSETGKVHCFLGFS